MFAIVKMFGHLITVNRIKTQIFIEYLTTGTIFAENKIKEVEDREHPDPEDHVSWAFAYSFFEKDYVEIEDQRVYLGKRKNVSKLFYPQARLLTIEDLEKEFPDKDILIRNLKSARSEKVIYTKERTFQIFDEKNDVILP
ncbi:MAG: hypothetical protein WCY37_02660 [Candidatus Dojkabacteria bacterium]